MPERAERDSLRDIREAVRWMRMYTDAMTCDRLLAEVKTQDAVIRNLEVICEATKSYRRDYAGSIPMCLGKAWPGSEIGSFITTLRSTWTSYGILS